MFQKVVLCILILVLPTIQLTNAQEKDLPTFFRTEWRSRALSLIDNHLLGHPGCELGHIRESIQTMRIYLYPFKNRSIRAYTCPNRDLSEPRIFINSDWNWDEELGVLTLIHEALHVTWRNNNWICGPDRNSRPISLNPTPSCRLFGGMQYNSLDIDRDLREHLSKELKLVKENVMSNGK